MFERPKSGERALLVHVTDRLQEPLPLRYEFEELVAGCGAEVVCSIPYVLRKPEPKYLIGGGRAEEILEIAKATCAELIIFSAPLTPSQERNLEKLFEARVLDRSGLILDIFAQRAQSYEGKLQVELAQLKHLSTRLVRGWTHLERQKGGIGMRGPGETQLETDRRLVAGRIKSLSQRLDKIVSQREQRRAKRRKVDMPTVAIVGYTNAGKSTIFNALTRAGVYQADQLFATLDTTVRQLTLESGNKVVIADTVGFIRDLPHELVAAFRATLEEARDADLLLHVVDASDPERDEHMFQVNQVLEQLGAGEIPSVKIYNKIDCVADAEPKLETKADGEPLAAWLSAGAQIGLEGLHQAVHWHCAQQQRQGWLKIPALNAKLRARCYDNAAVLAEEYNDDGDTLLKLSVGEAEWSRLGREFGALELSEQRPH